MCGGVPGRWSRTRRFSACNNRLVRYLSTADTIAAMPSIAQQLQLAEAALISVGAGGEVPGKSSVHPRPQSSIAYAMPANLTQAVAGVRPAFGMKWVTVFPDNPASGLPAIDGLIILNEPDTLATTAIIAASAITAARTAAVSGVVLTRLISDTPGRAPRVGLIGAGTQGRSHLPVLAHVAPQLDLVIWDRDSAQAEHVVGLAHAMAGFGTVAVAEDARAAVEGCDVLITATSFGPVRQVLPIDWLSREVLVIAVDYDMYASAALAQSATAFLVDEIGGFENSRREGSFVGFPDPTGTIGAFLRSGTRSPPGRVLVAHLGMGLSDLLFAVSIVDRAAELGLGTILPDTEVGPR
jgi:ornithine cyclodeaminase/alanine dehydrogenase-like protein (mu-crystallin family)